MELIPSMHSANVGWWKKMDSDRIPSGKHTKNYGKSAFLMGKLTIKGHFQ
jgi:hypothetical protein